MPKYGPLPPLDIFPEPVAAIASELLDLRVRSADLNREAAELRGSDQQRLDDPAMAAAQKADAELLADAARNGKDARKVGTPNADKLTAARKDLVLRQQAIAGAMERVMADLHAVILEHLEETRSIAADIIASRADEYRQAIDTLSATRKAYIEAEAIADFCDSVETARQGQVSYRPNAGRDISVDRLKAMTADQMISSLKLEADGGRKRRQTVGAGFDT